MVNEEQREMGISLPCTPNTKVSAVKVIAGFFNRAAKVLDSSAILKVGKRFHHFERREKWMSKDLLRLVLTRSMTAAFGRRPRTSWIPTLSSLMPQQVRNYTDQTVMFNSPTGSSTPFLISK